MSDKMGLRKAFIFRGGKRIKPSDEPLKYLDNSLAKLKATLEEGNNWDVEDFVLNSSDDVALKLRGMEDSQTNEILLFYTGHGVPQPQNRYALIGEDSNEILFDNIINAINKFNLTRFVLIIDACHSSEIEKSIPRVDNIEVVSSVSRGLAYEDELFESSKFVHYFTQAIMESSQDIESDISLEHICQSINANNETLQKPLRIPPIQSRFTKHITIAPSRKPIKERPLPNAPIEFPTGQVPYESIFYIAREDYKAYDMLRSDYSLIRIKAPRQYGKTSLLSRLLKTARNEHYQVVAFNFQEFDHEMLENLDELLSFICDMVGLECDIEPQLNEKILQRLTPKMRASKVMESLLSQTTKPIVLAIDEADRLFGYGNVSDEFFGLIRAWHEKSKDNPKWQKLKLILSHSTEPLLGITSVNQSPFHNVGLAMDLQAFNMEEITYLANQAHTLNLSNSDLAKLHRYIGGHPYLTRKVLYEMATEGIDLIEALNPKRFEEHLRRYKIIFENNTTLIETIKKVIHGDCPNTQLCYILEATGFINRSINNITFNSKLYEEFFKNNF